MVIKGILHTIGSDYFNDISGCAVVQHMHGLVQKERPHYHIWLPSGYNVNSTKKLLRDYYDSKIADLKWNTHANAYYTVKEHDSIEKWLEYVIDPAKADCKKPEILCWNISDRSRPVVRSLDELILPDLSGSESKVTVVSARKHITTQDKQAKFYKYVKEFYELSPGHAVDHVVISDLLYEYSTGGFNVNAAPQYIEYALYHQLKAMGDTVSLEQNKAHWTRQIMKKMGR